MRTPTTDERLDAAAIESLERRILELALERTRATNGAIFLWDAKEDGLAIDFHVVEGLVVNLPRAILRKRRDGRPNGIALRVFERDEAYVCADTATDPHYASYFLDVGSIAAVPIRYQRRAIGVLSVSSRDTHAFGATHLAELEALAASSVKFLRRAQLFRATSAAGGRPFLIKGLSPGWLEVERQMERAAPTDVPVLVHGESGTGKELVAHAIHFNSKRASGPFVAVNAAAIPETLLESVLFGHVRGAFTGAGLDKIGEFKKAHGGTLFLDEIGELPLGLQAKVLRAVEYGEVLPLGSNKAPERVDVRLVCATHRDLVAMARAGSFRDDLYYRIGVMTLELPPLRAFKDNLDVLAQVFASQATSRHGFGTPKLLPDALAALRAYDFPGNLRELKNAMEHAVIMSGGEPVRVEHLPRTMAPSRSDAPAGGGKSIPPGAPHAHVGLKEQREAWLAPLERAYLSQLLRETSGNVREAAAIAGVDTVTMYRLLVRRGVYAPKPRKRRSA